MNKGRGGGSAAPYLTALGAWALAFGCSVGWGSFVMPGNTFLPIAGPVGSAIGLALGAAVMIILAKNYHYLINRYPDCGGSYTFIKKSFGYDHGFLSAWFLMLVYVAIIWANASALPLIARTLLGSTFQFGFDYEIAGYRVWFGEILLAVGSLAAGALICLRRKLAEKTQIITAILLFGGIVVCFVAAFSNGGATAQSFEPAYSPDTGSVAGIVTVLALAPWAFVGFESISHSAAEAKYPRKKTFRILVIAIITAAAAYILLALLAATALPEGSADWVGYLKNLGDDNASAALVEQYGTTVTQPTFFSAFNSLGNAGSVILGVAALCGIFTGLIGNYIALSRLIRSMSEDGLLPGKIGKLDKNSVPKNAIICIFAVSAIFPFLGRTAISWIVDVTTVGATIAYALASASAFKTARENKDKVYTVTGAAGLVVSVLFALEFLIPNITSVKTLSTESYLILAAWGIIGFIVFRVVLKYDTHRRLGRSNVALVVLFGLVIFTSSVWMRQTADSAIQKAMNGGSGSLNEVDRVFDVANAIQVIIIVAALALLFSIYAHIQKREKQIEVEKALAEESSRAKTSFLSNMSHEIRTPMNAIIGLDNIVLRDPDLSPRTRDHLEKIGSSAKHLLSLINDILDMSRIESGRMVLKDEEFSFREFIEQVNIIINGQCQDKGLHYECRVAGSVADYYRGDDMKLKQVLINILGNSVKFTDAPGEVELTAEQISREDDGCLLRFRMRDTGIGMDKEFIPKIFEAFSQEDATTTNRYGGSGLGMAITKNFVAMMGGDIEVESEKGVGSVFTVTVRLGASDKAFVADQAGLPEGLRALVVDDDGIACESAQITLKTLGVEADTALSAGRALGILKAALESGRPYDVLLTDYRMPEKDGMELVRELRDLDGGKTAVIVLTGYNRDLVEEEAAAEGVKAVIAKPLFADTLLRALRTAVCAESVSAAAPEENAENALAGKRILIAEDMDANAEILADLLELEDVLSERAENGKAAVEAFGAKPAGYFDAILMDVRMPVMDGLSATEAIRALPREDAKEIPIIAMTANVFDEDVERSMKAGMNAHLSKPIEPEVLYETLRNFIK